MSRRTHVSYPHIWGRLHDCTACEIAPCWCRPGDAPCVSLWCDNAEAER